MGEVGVGGFWDKGYECWVEWVCGFGLWWFFRLGSD